MSKLIFVNLPVENLDRSIAFYEAIGAEKNTQFSDDTGACMVLSDVIHVMILTHEKFKRFAIRPIPDVRVTGNEVLLCLSADSKTEVDALVTAAASAGGRADVNAPDDHGFMYGRSFEDPDGHVWETMWMDMAGFQAAQGQVGGNAS